MSMHLSNLAALDPRKKLTRTQIIALQKATAYADGRTKQCHKDECDINKIMARFDKTGTISHLAKFEGVYADYSDFDFHEQTNKLTQGREIFDALPAEIRREFGQSPAAFFEFVNDPENIDHLREKLPDLAKPGQQLPAEASPTADHEAAVAAASEPASEPPEVTPPDPES